jgi:hypothetical protein
MKVSSFEKVTFKSHDHLCWQSDLVFLRKGYAFLTEIKILNVSLFENHA